jgi:hypothetical protein
MDIGEEEEMQSRDAKERRDSDISITYRYKSTKKSCILLMNLIVSRFTHTCYANFCVDRQLAVSQQMARKLYCFAIWTLFPR